MTTLARLELISRSLDTSLTTHAKRPDVALEIKYYKENIEQVKSIDDFLKDDRLFKFAMKAFGLGDFAYAKAFMRKVLTEGIDSPSAFANVLTDSRYREFADAFNFKRYGETATIFDKTRQGTVDRYIRQSLEEVEGASNDNVRLALYFQRKADSIHGPFDILADKALTQFVFRALGLQATTSALDIDRQSELLSSRLNFDDFKSPDGISRLVTRFAAISELSSSATSAANSLLLLGSSSTTGIGIDLMLALQNTRRR